MLSLNEFSRVLTHCRYEVAARNSLLPFRIEHMLTNAEASQHTMDVAVYAGNRALAADCTPLGR